MCRFLEERGSALIELTLSLPISILLLAGSFSLGEIIREHQVVSQALKHGARVAVYASLTSCDDLEQAALSAVNGYLQSAGLDDLVDTAEFNLETHEMSFSIADDEEIVKYFTTAKVLIDEPLHDRFPQLFGSFGVSKIKSSASYVLERVCEDA